MKKSTIILSVAFITAALFQSCSVALPSRGIERPVDRSISEWTVVGSVRYEFYSKAAAGVIPYDNLLEEAHKKYGETVDIIEIKEDKIKLDPLTRAQMAREKKGVFAYKYIYNALVVKYE